MWNLSYACNLPLNLVAERYAKEGDAKKMYIPNTVLGQLIGFACRFIPAVILLFLAFSRIFSGGFCKHDSRVAYDSSYCFRRHDASLGMGIILSFLLKKKYQLVIFPAAGFILVTYFNLDVVAVAVTAIIASVLYFVSISKDSTNSAEGEAYND